MQENSNPIHQEPHQILPDSFQAPASPRERVAQVRPVKGLLQHTLLQAAFSEEAASWAPRIEQCVVTQPAS